MKTIEIILTAVGLFGIPSLYFGFRNFIFKQNIEFRRILQSFPLISENRFNDGTKTTVDMLTNIQISKEFTKFVENKKGDLDEFLANLERFDESKLIFKKKEIKLLIGNIKRILTKKSSNMQIEGVFDIKKNEITITTVANQFEWDAFNYYLINEIMKDKKSIDNLFVCKFLNF